MVVTTAHPILLFAAGIILFADIAFRHVEGGICWSGMSGNGRCTEMLALEMTREQCCQHAPGVATAWSAEDLESGSLFFLRVLGGGVPCIACKENCTEVDCGAGKKCVLRNGQPKCVCSPVCKNSRRSRGPVCGSDSRSYRNVCRLKKRACRKQSTALTVAYNGFCQSSCGKIKCPTGKLCVLDQNLSPHCVRCTSRCGPSSGSRPVCGADGVTYPNTCMLRQTACRQGKAIPAAYKGRCKELATCGSVRCRERQACLLDIKTGRPRCVTCASHCLEKKAPGPLCGSNNRTYSSWCHMLRDSCATGYVVDTAFAGPCSSGDVSLVLNSVIDNLGEDHYDV